jgi:hypothetical protein
LNKSDFWRRNKFSAVSGRGGGEGKSGGEATREARSGCYGPEKASSRRRSRKCEKRGVGGNSESTDLKEWRGGNEGGAEWLLWTGENEMRTNAKKRGREPRGLRFGG